MPEIQQDRHVVLLWPRLIAVNMYVGGSMLWLRYHEKIFFGCSDEDKTNRLTAEVCKLARRVAEDEILFGVLGVRMVVAAAMAVLTLLFTMDILRGRTNDEVYCYIHWFLALAVAHFLQELAWRSHFDEPWKKEDLMSTRLTLAACVFLLFISFLEKYMSWTMD